MRDLSKSREADADGVGALAHASHSTFRTSRARSARTHSTADGTRHRQGGGVAWRALIA